MEKVILHDQLINRQGVYMDIEDRGYQFGDGVYEVIRIYDGQLFAINEHIDRLFISAKKIQINVPLQKSKIIELIKAVVKENGVQCGTVYVQLTRGVAPRGHMFPKSETKPTFLAYTTDVPKPEKEMEAGVEAITKEDIRWLRCDIKSLNLLPNVLAKQEASEKDCFEAIFHRDSFVTEGASSNVFIVKDGAVITHPSNHLILNGITRQIIAKLCEEEGIPFVEQPFRVNELFQADELFISSTISEVMPVVKVDKKLIHNGQPGEVTKTLQVAFTERVQREISEELK